jgi:RHS repeat-associated protein
MFTGSTTTAAPWKSVSTASYVYNALGERAERNVGGAYTEYVYDREGSEAGENNRTSWTKSWVAFQGRHLFHFSGGHTYFTHMDSLETTSVVTDYSTGAVVQDELHYPWGQPWVLVGALEEERFARLHHRESETDLDPTLYRMYSSNAGRWLTPDALGGQPVNPQSLNRFGYVDNTPTNQVDPQGLCELKAGIPFSEHELTSAGWLPATTCSASASRRGSGDTLCQRSVRLPICDPYRPSNFPGVKQ